MPDDINNLNDLTGVNLEITNTIIPEIDINGLLIFTPSAESLSVPIIQLNNLDSIIVSQDPPIYEPTVDISTDESVDTLTGEAIVQVINQAVFEGHEYLQEFAANPEFEAKMDLAFGENWDKEANISLPAIEVISSVEINGANGAFAEATDTVYLSKEFLAQNLENIGEVTDVWLEEFGHSIDSQINIVDALGDEGEIFSAVAQGKDLSEADIEVLKGENDKAFLEIDGEEVGIEMRQKWKLEAYKNARNNDNLWDKPNKTLNGYFEQPDGADGIYINWKQGSPFPKNTNKNNFALQGTTKAKFKANQTYVFNLDADDDSFLSLGVKAPGAKSKTEWITPVNEEGQGIWESFEDGESKQYAFTPSKSGNYDVWFSYVEDKRNAFVDISWEKAKNEPATDPGSSLRSAYNIGKLGSKTRSFNEFVGSVDREDYYRFNLPKTSDFSLLMSGLSDSAKVELIYDFNNNNQVDSGDVLFRDSGSRDADIYSTLGKGNYFVRVLTDSRYDNTRYTLQMQATPTPPNTKRDPGSSLKTTYNIGKLGSKTRNFNEFVGSVDREDYYRFNLPKTSDFSLLMSGLSDSAKVELIYDFNNNNQVDSGDVLFRDSGSRDADIYSTLGKGNYFVRVLTDSRYDNTRYTLQMQATPTPPNTKRDPGSSLKTTYNIGKLGSKTRNFNEFVGSVDREDYYRFNLPKTSDFSLSMSGLSDFAKVELIYDFNNNNQVDSGDVLFRDSGSRDADIYSTLGKGNYFVRVLTDSRYDNTRYTLQMQATPTPPNTKRDPGSSLKTAYNIGKLGSKTRNFNEFVGSVDREDYYRFNLSKTSDFSLLMSGLSDYAKVELIYDSNNNNQLDSRDVVFRDSGSRDADIYRTLGKGNYFVRVLTDRSYDNTNYTLSLSASS
ncbi:MAG: hypothetical protein F6K40_14585 [Okeania sp. SIO3I5]|uniref:PPC domain-containing protein n=1 Tax=Okeania sp. SIO3I5 TaxID=2607805 RepID=UPI0013B7F3D8|nr:PPC domain-containing protein [Okeania sp. SIO3I5]NEQ37425.1 hypothetical protein [Okeania sp. SIO3I5]